jgi:hypothetical protein
VLDERIASHYYVSGERGGMKRVKCLWYTWCFANNKLGYSVWIYLYLHTNKAHETKNYTINIFVQHYNTFYWV